MKDEGCCTVDVGEGVGVFGIVLWMDDLESSCDASPKCVRYASFEATTLFAFRDAILFDEERRHGMVLTIVVAEVFDRVNSFSSDAGDKQVEVVHCELPVTVGSGVHLLDSFLEVIVRLGRVCERRKRRPDVFFGDWDIRHSILLPLGLIVDLHDGEPFLQVLKVAHQGTRLTGIEGGCCALISDWHTVCHLGWRLVNGWNDWGDWNVGNRWNNDRGDESGWDDDG